MVSIFDNLLKSSWGDYNPISSENFVPGMVALTVVGLTFCVLKGVCPSFPSISSDVFPENAPTLLGKHLEGGFGGIRDIYGVPRKGVSPLRHACFVGDVETVKALLDKDVDLKDLQESLLLVLMLGKEITPINVFLKHPKSKSVLNSINEGRGFFGISLLAEGLTRLQNLRKLEYRSCETIMRWESDVREMVSALIEHNQANLNSQDVWGETILEKAISSSNMEDVIRELVNHGALPFLRNYLGVSALEKYQVVCELTGSKSNDVNNNNSQRTDNTNPEIVSLLAHKEGALKQYLVKQASEGINQPDHKGWTPLHFAAFYGFADLVEKFIQNGADKTLKDTDGKTPKEIFAFVCRQIQKFNTRLPEKQALKALSPEEMEQIGFLLN